ncbi:hypothetical protein ScPMuIL_005405 [Solemya velum]
MPRRALRCVCTLSIQAITAPGVWLPNREDLYLSISLFGQYKNTRLAPSVFPVFFNEQFKFEKTYYTAVDLSQVADFLEDELIVLELVQLSDISSGATRLATFSTNAREFLYPYPTMAPSYTSAEREVLLCRTVSFPGIAPKLEFTTQTVIKESFSPELDALSDALEQEKYIRGRSRSRSRQRCRSRSVTPSRQRARSRSRSRSVSPVRRVSIPIPRARSVSPRRGSRPSSARSWSSWSSDEDRPRNYMKPTVASIFRSRSPSPSLSRQMEDINLYDYDSDTYPEQRPPFVVRHLSKDLIGRTPGTPAKKQKSKKKGKGKRPRSANGFCRKQSDSVCPLCFERFTEATCLVCQAYRRHTGRRYWGHTLYYHPTGQLHYCPKVVREPYDDPLPVFTSKYVPSDDEDNEVAALTSPVPIYRPRSRPTSPLLYKSSFRERFSDYPITPSQQVSSRVSRALNRNRSIERLNSLTPPLRTRSSYVSTLDDLAVETSLARNRRSLVHLDDGHYWTERAAEYQGKPHRQIFNENMGRVYTKMYKNALNPGV